MYVCMYVHVDVQVLLHVPTLHVRSCTVHPYMLHLFPTYNPYAKGVASSLIRKGFVVENELKLFCLMPDADID